jgi:predicted ABC-type ATPase
MMNEKDWAIEKSLFIFAGPNGSGKSTVIADFINEGKCPAYLICPDNFVATEDKDKYEPYIKAMQKAEAARYMQITLGRSFSMETVLSTAAKLEFIKYAKQQGYRIYTIYVTTSDTAINIERVKIRVAHGGHDVPTDKILSRYSKSLELMYDAANESDAVYFFDNSNEKPVLVAVKSNSQMRVIEETEWLRKYILSKT